MLQAPKPEVVLTSYEHLASDLPVFTKIQWDVVVLDERNRQRQPLAKAYEALKEIDTKHRVLMPHSDPLTVSLLHLQCTGNGLLHQSRQLHMLHVEVTTTPCASVHPCSTGVQVTLVTTIPLHLEITASVI